MSHKAGRASAQPRLVINGEVARQIRQHARTSPGAEICGVLIGQDRPGNIQIEARIAGANAEEAGAHVTFTQDTWEHIYQIKDKEYPDQRIVGWYHSHPGFGVFLSDHDTFIHKNFFASPGQVAWVYDPHSDEEGCFGWVNGGIERLSQITVADAHGGELTQESGRPEPTLARPINSNSDEEDLTTRARVLVRRAPASEIDEESSNDSLLRLTTTIFTFLAALLLGFFVSWYFFPRVELLPVPVDPMTGKPLPGYSLEEQLERSRPSADQPPANPSNQTPQSNLPNSSASKENHGQSK